jgi:hypothetical protein
MALAWRKGAVRVTVVNVVNVGSPFIIGGAPTAKTQILQNELG